MHEQTILLSHQGIDWQDNDASVQIPHLEMLLPLVMPKQ